MARESAKPFLVVLFCVNCLFVTSCAPTAALDHSSARAALSEIILRPSTSCEVLQEVFELDGLQPVSNPGELGIDYGEFWLETATGSAVRVWYMPVPAHRGSIILSPGAVGPMECQLLGAQELTRRGWSVTMYEYDGFGGSTGTASLEAIIPDLEAVVQWTRARSGHDQVTLHGTSLGSVPTVAIAAQHPAWVNGIILDSPAALSAEVERIGAFIGIDTEFLRAGLDEQLAPELMIAQVEQPLLIYMHGQDELTAPENVQMIYDAAFTEKELVVFSELDHVRGLYYSTDEYMAHLEAFLVRVWESDAATVSAE